MREAVTTLSWSGAAQRAAWRHLCFRRLVCACSCWKLGSQPQHGESHGAEFDATVRLLANPDALRFIPPSAVPFARLAVRGAGLIRQPVQSRCSVWSRAPQSFVDDRQCPYTTASGKPFVWIRARQVGGRMVLPGHGRQYYRLSPTDFTPADGLSEPWPLKPGELDPWYSLVERRLNMTGANDGIPWQPDSDLSRTIEPDANEKALIGAIARRWDNARPIMGRYASPLNSLELAAATGRMRCRDGAVVKRINVDKFGRVDGVTWVDCRDRKEKRSFAPLVFLCASSLKSTRLLLLSRSADSPEGLGTSSGQLGRNLMDHIIVSGWGSAPPLLPREDHEDGRSVYLPRFDLRNGCKKSRGFGVLLYQFDGGGERSHFTAVSFGEMLPRSDNRVTLHPRRKDLWAIPALNIDCSYGEEDLRCARLQAELIRDIASAVGVSLGRANHRPAPPGSAVHECGTARMGTDASNSVLDPNNQCWEAEGLYVTDGSSFPSQGTQNPTLTILALTARACQHAVSWREVCYV